MKNLLGLLFSFTTLLLLFTNCGKQGFNVINPPASSENTLSSLDDPFMDYQWHLMNTGQKVFSLNAGTVGNDLNLRTTWGNGIYGQGIKILVSDDGIESAHEDIAGNYLSGLFSKDYSKPTPFLSSTAEPLNAGDSHGTSVAGLIAAVGWNHLGGRGVAPKAKLVSANFMSENVTRSTDKLIDQAKGNFDVFNQSWGENQDSVDVLDLSYKSQLLYGVTNYRNGKGAIYVKAAGNSFLVEVSRLSKKIELGNANFDSSNSTPYTINVGALAALPIAASYSSPGANLWITAPGGEDGLDRPAMLTTDRTGCDLGFAASSTSSKLSFQKGEANNTLCKYNATFNGTSSSAPVVSGVAALILEANPNLSWRELKYILAKTATQVHTNIAPFENVLYTTTPNDYANHKSPTGYTYEQGWVSNGAGFKFHNWYGFGRVNVDAAVAMAKNFNYNLGTYTDTGWDLAHKKSSLNLNIPDYSAVGIADSMTVSTQIKVEAVQLKLKVAHANIGTLAVELTSPAGTKSIVVNMNNALEGLANYEDEILLINTFYQESTKGVWTLRLIDGRSGTTGTLNEWSLNFIGGQ